MASPPQSKTHFLRNLQSIRALAACLVLYHHYIRYPQIGLDDWYGAVGVDIFFVISGFVITYANRGRPVDFFVRRIIRIAPLYWLLTLAWVLLSLTFRISGSGLSPTDITGTLVLKSLFFIPDQPIITRGWTLNYEMYFYTFFTAAMVLSKKFTALICLGMITLVYTIVNASNVGRPLAFYGSTHVFEFLMGSLVFYIWKGLGTNSTIVRFVRRSRWVLFFATLALLVICCVFSDIYRNHTLVPVTITSGLFVLAVVSLEEYGGLSINNRLLILLGDASYSIYLVHRFIYAPMARVVFPQLDHQPVWMKLIAFVPISAIVIACSVVVHLLVERPVTRLLSELWRRKSGHSREKVALADLEWNDKNSSVESIGSPNAKRQESDDYNLTGSKAEDGTRGTNHLG